MINLAGIRYRNIFSDRGGPVERVETCDMAVESRRMFQANAFLCPGLLTRKAKNEVYSDAAGSGTHESPMIARYMAISEAMERWAFHATASCERRDVYGFDVDPMSTGMAAFPGLVAHQARRKAYLEALERFSLLAWWEGMLPAFEIDTEWPEVKAAVIWARVGEVAVILHKRTAEGCYAYGHAAGDNFRSACRSAVVELARHEHVVREYFLTKARAGTVIEAPRSRLERRCVYFASEEGHEAFLRRLRTPPTRGRPQQRLAFDGPIPGPWSRYADVWRVVFHPVSRRFLEDDDRYFLW